MRPLVGVSKLGGADLGFGGQPVLFESNMLWDRKVERQPVVRVVVMWVLLRMGSG